MVHHVMNPPPALRERERQRERALSGPRGSA